MYLILFFRCVSPSIIELVTMSILDSHFEFVLLVLPFDNRLNFLLLALHLCMLRSDSGLNKNYCVRLLFHPHGLGEFQLEVTDRELLFRAPFFTSSAGSAKTSCSIDPEIFVFS